jgi:hypothetical protein
VSTGEIPSDYEFENEKGMFTNDMFTESPIDNRKLDYDERRQDALIEAEQAGDAEKYLDNYYNFEVGENEEPDRNPASLTIPAVEKPTPTPGPKIPKEIVPSWMYEVNETINSTGTLDELSEKTLEEGQQVEKSAMQKMFRGLSSQGAAQIVNEEYPTRTITISEEPERKNYVEMEPSMVLREKAVQGKTEIRNPQVGEDGVIEGKILIGYDSKGKEKTRPVVHDPYLTGTSFEVGEIERKAYRKNKKKAKLLGVNTPLEKGDVFYNVIDKKSYDSMKTYDDNLREALNKKFDKIEGGNYQDEYKMKRVTINPEHIKEKWKMGFEANLFNTKKGVTNNDKMEKVFDPESGKFINRKLEDHAGDIDTFLKLSTAKQKLVFSYALSYALEHKLKLDISNMTKDVGSSKTHSTFRATDFGLNQLTEKEFLKWTGKEVISFKSKKEKQTITEMFGGNKFIFMKKKPKAVDHIEKMNELFTKNFPGVGASSGGKERPFLDEATMPLSEALKVGGSEEISLKEELDILTKYVAREVSGMTEKEFKEWENNKDNEKEYKNLRAEILKGLKGIDGLYVRQRVPGFIKTPHLHAQSANEEKFFRYEKIYDIQELYFDFQNFKNTEIRENYIIHTANDKIYGNLKQGMKVLDRVNAKGKKEYQPKKKRLKGKMWRVPSSLKEGKQ